MEVCGGGAVRRTTGYRRDSREFERLFSAALEGLGNGAHGQGDRDALVSFQRDIVLRLTGGAEISPGVRVENRGSAENRALVRTFLATTLESIRLDPLRQPYSESGENVYALLPSTTPSGEYIVLGAHFDTNSRSPGASDNATGCAAVLGVARNLVALSHRSRNVYLVLFDEEERGLLGSAAFARMLQGQRADVVAVHTVDQLG